MRVILTDHDLGVMDEATQALFAAGKNVQAIGLGAVVLRLRGQIEPFLCEVDESAGFADVVELHPFSRRVGA